MQAISIPIQTDAPVLYGRVQGEWTADDWEALLPDEQQRYEIIDGVLYVSTAPSFFHQFIIANFYEFVGVPLKQNARGLMVLSPIGVFMPGTQPVQPDLVIIQQARLNIIHDRRIHGVPDVIIEVLSPGNTSYDTEVKFAAYESAGVPEYLMVSPTEQTVKLVRLNRRGKYTDIGTFRDDAQVHLNAPLSVTFTVRDLFAGAPDTSL